jgi:hypothetical protein
VGDLDYSCASGCPEIDYSEQVLDWKDRLVLMTDSKMFYGCRVVDSVEAEALTVKEDLPFLKGNS